MGLNDNLEGLWHFSGNALDSSGNGNNGTVNGATLTTDKNGQSNKAYLFDGVNDNITLPETLKNLTNWTIEFFFQTSSSKTTMVFISKNQSGTNNDISCEIRSSNFFVSVDNGSSFLEINQSVGNMKDGIWHHYAVTYDGTTMKGYYDGIEIGSNSLSGCSIISNTKTWEIGSDRSSVYYEGKIDEPRIYSRALSHDEILQLAKGYDTDADVINNTQTYRNQLYYSLDNGDLSGSNPLDISGNGNNGTNNGATTGVTGVIKEGFSFDGVNDYMNLGSNTDLIGANPDSWSFGLWFYADVWKTSDNGYNNILSSYGAGSTFPFKFTYRNVIGNPHFYVQARYSGTSYTNQIFDSITVGEWHHIVGIFNKGKYVHFYLDGVFYGDGSATNILPNQDFTTSSDVVLSSLATTNLKEYFDGKIDEVGIWDRDLTPNEILELYNSGNGKNPYAPEEDPTSAIFFGGGL